MKTKPIRYAMPFLILGLVTGVLAQPTPVRAATYTVNSIDDRDDGACDAVHCSLREAINQANGRSGPDTIAFNIPGSSPHSIRLLTPLPAISDNGTTIAGDTQPGYSVDLHYASGLRSRGRPAVILDGALMVGDWSFSVASDDNVIRDISFTNFSNGYDTRAVDLLGDRNLFEGNFVGIYPDSGPGTTKDGIRMWGENNLIQDNVFWASKSAIEVWSGNGHRIQGNLIGTDPTGHSSAHSSSGYGIITTYDPDDLLIGGTEPGDRNVISGFYPGGTGINVAFGVRIVNNSIGTNADGNATIPNGIGVKLSQYVCERDSSGFCVGAPTVVQGNLISGNVYGVLADAERSIIKGNLIGTDATGSFSLGYQEYGISSAWGRQIFIGGRDPGDGNLISGNGTGIELQRDAVGIEVYGNQIGTNLSGTAAISNQIGIEVLSTNTIIGYPGSGNLISGNTFGIKVANLGNRIWANRIGTNAAGSRAIPNYEGIRVSGDHRDIELSISDENLIAFNTTYGIHLIDTIHVIIAQNIIHHNGADGIYLEQTGTPATSVNWIKENSIYSNGIRGIRFNLNGINDGAEPPILTEVTTTSATGTTCPNCHVELFVSDRDPSGLGEGKKFVAAVDAGPDGAFHADFDWRFSDCDSLTATATNSSLSTSEFSRDVGVTFCALLPSLSAWFLVIGAGGGGSAFLLIIVFLLRRPRHLPGPASTVGLGLLGGLLGAGIGIGLLATPFVQIQWPQGRQGGQAPPSGPTCTQFINENMLQPADNAVFPPGTDVVFQLSPQPDPPGMQTRWFLDVTGPGNKTMSKELTSNSIRLSDVGFDPQQTGVYLWKLRGERAPAGSNTWTPLCADAALRVFRIEAPTPVPPTATATATPTATPTPSTTATPTVTATSSIPTATLLQNAYCLHGPAEGYGSVTMLFQGVQVPIVGRNQDGTWWYVVPPNSQNRCWVAGGMVRTSGNVNGLPVVQAPPLGCWVKNQNNKNICTVPCPEGAKPGGACEP